MVTPQWTRSTNSPRFAKAIVGCSWTTVACTRCSSSVQECTECTLSLIVRIQRLLFRRSLTSRGGCRAIQDVVTRQDVSAVCTHALLLLLFAKIIVTHKNWTIYIYISVQFSSVAHFTFFPLTCDNWSRVIIGQVLQVLLTSYRHHVQHQCWALLWCCHHCITSQSVV